MKTQSVQPPGKDDDGNPIVEPPPDKSTDVPKEVVDKHGTE